MPEMKIAVIGSDSFLAYHLISALVKSGHSVLGCDLKKSGNTIDLLNEQKNFEFHECDITDAAKLKKLLRDADCIYHLAAISSERFCREEPLKSFEINVRGVLNALDAAKEKKPLFVFSSSGSVYPDSLTAKKEEESDFGGKFYGTSKLTAEKYCRLFNKQFGIPLVIFRFSRLYGPRMERNPIYDISKALSAKEKILLYEGLESKYDFIYAEDAARSLLNALDKKWAGGIFNISSAEGVKLKDLIALYFKTAGFEVPVEVKRDVSETDILDNSKALSFGFKPRIELGEGLKRTFLYFVESRISNRKISL